MGTQSLTLLVFLLLTAQVLLVEGKREKGRKKEQGLGHRSQSRVRLAKGRFLTQDQAECRWAVVEERDAATLKVECTRTENQFSCYFGGHPRSCPEFISKKKVYWKQIGRNLAQQKNICEDSQTILKTRLCGKKFPEALLKMVNSTLIKKKASTMATVTTPKLTVVSGTKETVPAETQEKARVTGSECELDPDVQYQKKLAQDYCGESWGTFCQFFLSMFQDTQCE